MYGLPIELLYSAFKLKTIFSDGLTSSEVEGTGFFVRHEDVFFLVTNRHVIDLKWKHSSKNEKAQKYSGYLLSTIECSGRPSDDRIRKFIIIKPDIFYSENYTDDVAVIKLGSVLGVDDILEPPTLNHYISSSDIATSDKFDGKIEGVNVCDQIAFPVHSHEFSVTLDRPTFRMGWIASDPRYPLELENVTGDAFLTEAFSTSGSSGAPVFALQKGFPVTAGSGVTLAGGLFRAACLIGVNAGHVKSPTFGHANLSYAFKSSIILNCIRNAQRKSDT